MKLLAAFFLLTMALFAAGDASGKWSGSYTGNDGSGGTAYLILKQSGGELTGTGGPDVERQWPIAKGKVEGAKVSGEVQHPDGAVYKFKLTLEGDSLKGEVELPHDGQTDIGKLDLTRVK